jgi:hypothetical protein
VHRWLVAHEIAKRLGDDPERNYDLDQERARLAHYQAEVAKLTASEKRRELWPLPIIGSVLEAMTTIARDKFKVVREKLATHPRITAEIREALENLHKEALDELREDRLPPDLVQALSAWREKVARRDADPATRAPGRQAESS